MFHRHGAGSRHATPAGQGWTPRYDMYLDGSSIAQVSCRACSAGHFQAICCRLLRHRWQNATLPVCFRSTPARLPDWPVFSLPVAEAHFGTGLQSSFSFVLKNSEQLHLPGGDANIYKSGEYVGRFRFEGISSGRSRVISMGM